MTRPAELPRWTSDPGVDSPGAVEPNDGKKDDGFRNAEEPGASEFNWLFKHHADWISYVVQSMPAARGWKKVHQESDSLTRFLDGCFAPGAGTGKYGMFIFVGINEADTHLLATSLDAETWNVSHADPDVYRGVAHGGSGAFGSKHTVIVGSSATNTARIWSAPDDPDTTTLTLTSQVDNIPGGLPADCALNSVAWNGTVWCAGGRSGTILTATAHDGAWTQRTLPGGYDGDIFKIIARGSRLLAFGRSSDGLGVDGSSAIFYSDNNGATWTSVHSDTDFGDLTSAVHCDGTLVLLVGTSVGDTILRSDDAGLTWDEVDTIPTSAAFETEKQELLFYFDGVAYAVLKPEGAQTRLLVASYDLGLTWPTALRDGPITWQWTASANDGCRVCAGGGDPFFTTAAVLHRSDAIFAPV